MAHSTAYTVGFAALICGFWGTVVSVAAVNLKPLQVENKILDQQKQVLEVAGLKEPGKEMAKARINELFEKHIRAEVVDFESDEPVKWDAAKIAAFDQQRAKRDPERSERAPANAAKVLRRPLQGKVFKVLDDEGQLDAIVVPVEGYGLWSTLLGYVALEEDAVTIKGITYYEHKETPGLGGEVDNPLWKGLWPRRKAYDAKGEVAIQVAKGNHGPPEKDPHKIDALSGATITSNGVTNMMRFWLGDEGFGPYLKKQRKGGKQ